MSYKNILPKINKKTFIANNVSIIGDVSINENSSILFNCVIRGDVAPISIGKNTNIQDGTIIHGSRHTGGNVHIGDNVTIGHSCVIHGCYINDGAFIGMSSTIMDHVIIEEYAFIGAGSLVTQNQIIKSKELWLGSPAKFVRYLTIEDLNQMNDNIQQYIQLFH